MSAQIQVSREEKRMLLLIGFVTVGLIVFLVLLNFIFNMIGLAAQNPNEVEIAVFVQNKDTTPGKEILEVARLGADKASAELKADGKTFAIRIHAYETGDSPNSAAWAAMLAARNPNTVAAIGPFDARQSIAVAETLSGKNIAILTPSSLSQVVSSDKAGLSNIFYLSLPYSEQASHLSAFMTRNGWDQIFLIAEQTTYAQKVLEIFNPTANQIIQISGTANASSQTSKDMIAKVKEANPKAVLYIGKPDIAIALLNEMKQAGVQIPFVGLDTLSEPSFLSAYNSAAPVYYASSLLNLQAVPAENVDDLYRNTLGDKMGSPYAFETFEGVWFIASALRDGKQYDNSLRETVWTRIRQGNIAEWNGSRTVSFRSNWRVPQQIFFYELTQAEPKPKLMLTMGQ